jgi:ABC-type lipoprotein export system ATPase subunit
MIRLAHLEKHVQTKAGSLYLLRQIMVLFKRLNEKGVTIVQVTHNEAWAAYSHRIIRLRDGWMER